jgi:hypothetical protein
LKPKKEKKIYTFIWTQGINCGIAFSNRKKVSLNNNKLNPKELEGDLNLNPPKMLPIAP